MLYLYFAICKFFGRGLQQKHFLLSHIPLGFIYLDFNLIILILHVQIYPLNFIYF